MRHYLQTALLLLTLVALASCSGSRSGGLPDAGDPEVGEFDSGGDDLDACWDPGEVDTGWDAGEMDAGSDTGAVDAGRDTGKTDTGRDVGKADVGTDTGRPDTGPTCVSECLPGPVDGCRGRDIIRCGDYNGDSCFEYGIVKSCPTACYGGECVECGSADDCPNPAGHRCYRGSCIALTTWADTEVIYDATYSIHAVNCSSCSPSFTASTGGATLPYLQDDGYVNWAMTINRHTLVGEQLLTETGPVEIGIYGNSASIGLPARYRGIYKSIGGKVNFSKLELRYGGSVCGVFDAVMAGGNDTTPIEIKMKSSFCAQLPE